MARKRETNFGTGFTRQKRVRVRVRSFSEAREAMDDAGPLPMTDLEGWLQRIERQLREKAEAVDLPFGRDLVAYVPGTSDTWRPWRTGDDLAPGEDAVMAFLFLEEFDEQSPAWYFGTIFRRIQDLRAAIERGDSAKVAGRAILLGRLLREWELKEPADRWAEAQNKGGLAMIASKNRQRIEKERIVRSIRARMVWDPDNMSANATRILELWPTSKQDIKPSHQTVRKMI